MLFCRTSEEAADWLQLRHTCHGEAVHVVEQVDVAEDEDGLQRLDFGHPAGRLVLLLIRRRPALVLCSLRLAVRR